MLRGHTWTHFYFSVKYVVCLLYVACGAQICYMDMYTQGGQWVDTEHLNCSLPWVFLDPWSLWTWNSLIRLTGWPVSFSDPLVSTSLLGLQVHASSHSFYASAGDLNSRPHAFMGQALHKEIYLWWAQFKGEYLLLLPRDMQRSTLCRQGWVSYTQWSKPPSHMDTIQQHHYHTLKLRQLLLQQGEGLARSHCLNLVLGRLPHGRLSTVGEVRIPRAFHQFLPSQIYPINFLGLLTSSPWHSLLSKVSHFLNRALSYFFID